MTESEIRAGIVGEDIDSLKRSVTVVNERLSVERTRNQRAEARASAMLAGTGLTAGFLAHLGRLLASDPGPNAAVLIVFIGTCVLIVKAAYYSLSGLRALRGYEITPELALKMESLSVRDAAREELVWKTWEYYQLLPVTNDRLFRASRAQRNLLFALVLLVVIGTLVISRSLLNREATLVFARVLGVVVACGFSEFCRGFSLNFVAAGRVQAASSAEAPRSSLWLRVR